MRPTRYLADLLSAGNLASGVAGVAAAAAGRPDLSLGLLLLGGAFDGFDGLAARRFGGTPLGVLSDDIADAVTNGVMPGAAVGILLGGPTGWALGGLFAVATITRLVFFTLLKGQDDPRWFRGLPSTAGAALVLAALVLFGASPALVGAVVGLASALMLSFGFRYVHIGRLVASSRRGRIAGLTVAGGLAGSALLLGPAAPAAALLLGGLVWGLAPVFSALGGELAGRRAAVPGAS